MYSTKKFKFLIYYLDREIKENILDKKICVKYFSNFLIPKSHSDL